MFSALRSLRSLLHLLCHCVKKAARDKPLNHQTRLCSGPLDFHNGQAPCCGALKASAPKRRNLQRTSPIRQTRPLALALRPMELRNDGRHKENVAPRPATPLRPEQRRFLKSRGVGPGSGHGRWVRVCQAEREASAATHSPGAARLQEPCRVQTNLAGPSPGLSLILQDTTGRLMNSSSQQQSNVQTPGGRPQGGPREFAVRQSNLSIRGASLAECRSHLSPRLQSGLRDSFWPNPGPRGGPLSRASLACPSSPLLGTDTPCPDVQPATAFAPYGGHTRPGSRPWCVLGSWPPRLLGEPLTLEDLTVPVQSQARFPSHSAFHQLLASVRQLEHEVARLGCRAAQDPAGPARWDPWTGSGQALPAHRQPSQSVLASWGGRENPVRGLRETAGFPGTQGAWAGLSDCQASSEPASLETALRMPAVDFLDPKQGVFLANRLRQGENVSLGPTYGRWQKTDPQLPQGGGNREARPYSSARSRAARGVPPGQEGREVAPQEQVSKEEERTAPCPPDAAAAQSGPQVEARGGWPWGLGGLRSAPGNSLCQPAATTQFCSLPPRRGSVGQAGLASCPASSSERGFPGPQGRECSTRIGARRGMGVMPSPQLPPGAEGPGLAPDERWAGPSGRWLSRCFRAWWHLVRKQRAVAAAVALSRQQLLHRGLRALRRALRLREARLEAVWKRHTRALLAQSFRKWRNQTLQQKQGQPQVQAGPGPPPSGTDQGQSPSGREPVADPAWRSRAPGWLHWREEAGAWPRADGGKGEIQMLQALQQLAGFLLWCHQKEWARQERGGRGEAPQAMLRTQRRGTPPRPGSHVADTPRVASLDTQPQRAWLRRWFGAWQQFVQRGAQYRDRLAHRRAGTLKTCLQQWVWMKQLQASDGAKVTRLSLCWQKAGAPSPSHPGKQSRGLGAMAQEQGCGSLQEACRRLALRRALLLWRTRLSQRQRADSFLQGVRQQMILCILKGWHLRAWHLGTPSGSARSTLAMELLASIPGGEALLGCGTAQSSLEVRGWPGGGPPPSWRPPWLSFLWAAGQQRKTRCFLLWQVQTQRSRRAARWRRRPLQRRPGLGEPRVAVTILRVDAPLPSILLGWSHWATAQGAQGELAVGWAWDRSCRAALGVWRRWLAQRLKAGRWARTRDRTLVRGALHRWHARWQTPRGISLSLATEQQLLQEKYQRWVQLHLQGLRRSVFQNWRWAAARRRCTAAPPEQSHFQAPRGVARDAEVFPATRAFQDGLREAPGTTVSMWREAGAAKARAREQHMPSVPMAHWRSCVQGGRAVVPRRRRVALGWTWVLEARAQAAARGRVQRAAVTQFRQAASRRLAWTRRAQWQAALLRGWSEPRGAGALGACTVDRRQQPGVASRGHLQALPDTPAQGKQRSSWAQALEGPKWGDSLLAGCAGTGTGTVSSHDGRTGEEAVVCADGHASAGHPLRLPRASGPHKRRRPCFRGRRGKDPTRPPEFQGPKPIGSAFPLRLFPQTHGYRTRPSPTQQHSRGGQKERREMSWAQSKEALNPLPATWRIHSRYLSSLTFSFQVTESLPSAVPSRSSCSGWDAPAPPRAHAPEDSEGTTALRPAFSKAKAWPPRGSWGKFSCRTPRGSPEPWPEPGPFWPALIPSFLEDPRPCPSTWSRRAPGAPGHQGAQQGLAPPPPPPGLQEEIPAVLAPGGSAPPAAVVPAGQVPGSNMAAVGTCSGRGAAGTHAGERGRPLPSPALISPLISPQPSPLSALPGGILVCVGPGAGICINATPSPDSHHSPSSQCCTLVGGRRGRGAEGRRRAGLGPHHLSPQLRQWHLRRAWRVWRWRVLRLRAARRLQQQEGGQVLSQAFEKWRQQLAARGRKRGATSGPVPPWKAGIGNPGSILEAARAPVWGGPGVDVGWGGGPSCSCDLFPRKEKQS
ncbi:LOW QUALITY PROTEIN: uncharacterized protein C1orf167 homolog [Hyaena hyaena]|uniref:LOW QUALITY PROTEIN: uncharacterized protein C1orf167 homolog n=1 Tax=Hyaena hyaena TaxID=95912 RepID=UPI001923E0B5|nr:LOW QUALITY PROTEIN: uncharacterized protein C1orf167 homolog [Hyaena hyaena]